MKVLLVHNRYRFQGGEEGVVESTYQLLQRRGVDVSLWMQDCLSDGAGVSKKIGAFFSGIYSPASAKKMAQRIEEEKPDVVHSHNLYPILSPSVLKAARKAGVAVVMTCHNYRLTCPIGLHFHDGRLCERCLGGKEYWCAIQNCRDSRVESLAYAARGWVGRSFNLFQNNVDIFLALSEYAKGRLTDSGIGASSIDVLPNTFIPPGSSTDASQGEYIAFVGRISTEKGIDTLMEASRLCGLPIRLAGDYGAMPQLASSAPDNVSLLGPLDREKMDEFYRRARMLVLPSVCFEMCPLVVPEAMGYGLPVVASRIGSLPEMVADGDTGLLFEAGNAGQLADKLTTLWKDPDKCRVMGQAGRERALRLYGEDDYFERLLTVYQKAIDKRKENG
jgi:glycosyltransferase involved in cell wall biosynthesis